MTMGNGFPGHSELATFADLRRDLEGTVVRSAGGVMRAGVFPAHFDPLVTGRSDMRVSVADFRAVLNRGGAIFIANAGVDTSVVLPAAPSANRRIDLIYAVQESVTLGDGVSRTRFGFVQGTASPTPTVPPLPANLSHALPVATVEIPAGATTTLSAGVVITQIYLYTAMAGGTVAVRTLVELAAWTPSDGARAYCVADRATYVRRGGAWVNANGLIASGTLTNESVFLIDGLSGYSRYEIVVNLTSASVANDLSIRLAAGGAANAETQYDRQASYANGTTAGGVEALATGIWTTLLTAPRTQKTFQISCLNLGRAEPTVLEVAASGMNATANLIRADSILRHRAATVFDGIYLIASTGTFSGWYEVRAA